MKTFSTMGNNDLAITTVAYSYLMDHLVQGRPLVFKVTQPPNDDGTPAEFDIDVDKAVTMIHRLKELISAVNSQIEENNPQF